MVTSFPSTIEERRELVSELLERAEPGREHLAAVLGQRVRPLRRPGQLGAPLGGDDPVLLQRTERPVEISDVDAVVSGERREQLEELVAVRGPIGEQEEERRLAETLDAGTHLPPAALVADAIPRACSSSSAVHGDSICKLHMSVT
jgi:hypothetical protein